MVRSFQRGGTIDPVPAAVVALLRRIDLGAGSESHYADQMPELLRGLAASARVESITASSAIEGVFVDERRRGGLLDGRTRRFLNRSEAEFAGYRLALDYALERDPGLLSVGLVLHLHRLLGSFTDAGGGQFKNDDNLVVDHGVDGRRVVRFTPVSARATPNYVADLVERTNECLGGDTTHPLITIAAFILDLLCIHPFADGNGRIARLLTTTLLDRAGYRVVRYVSLEQLIFDRKGDYYASLAASTTGWFEDGTHDVWPWTTFLLECLADAYTRFGGRVSSLPGASTKQERIREHILHNGPTTFRISDIRRAVPGVSDQTIHLVLRQLKAAGQVDNDGTGRSAAWTRSTSGDIRPR